MKPFKIDVDDAILEDLKTRLHRVRWPGEPSDAAWRYGANLGYMRRLIDYWRDDYDWRAAEASLNRYPQFTVPVRADSGEDLEIHLIHERGSGDNPLPLLLLHGWPGSVAEHIDAVEPLAHPERFGGRAEDGFDVVVPSLPGYGFSQAPARPMGPKAMASMFTRLMRDVLGYGRYGAQGGDWGSIIVARMALDHPDNLAAVHVNMAPLRPYIGDGTPPLSEAEQAWIKQAQNLRTRETAYQEVHATKSQSLAYGLTDSPVGLAGWITEKFHGWSTPEADEPPFPMDALLTNIMIYWITGCMNSSTWLYRAFREEQAYILGPGEGVTVPMGVCLPPNDLIPPPPPEWVQRMGNVVRDTRLADGGHFTMLQKGPELIDDIRVFFRETAR